MSDAPSGGPGDADRADNGGAFAAPARYAAGWYPDPLARFEMRFHNGTAWTADVADEGERFVDPSGTSAGPRTPAVGPEAPSGVATAAMAIGIVGVSLSWLPILGVIGAIAAVTAIALGWVALRRARPAGTTPGAGRGRALVGIGTGIGGLVGAVVGAYLTVVVLDIYTEYLEPEPAETRVLSCDLVGARASATVEITNVGDEIEDYSVVVAFVRPGTDNPHRTDRVDVDGVEPGGTATFEAERQVELDAIDCLVTDVTGALPFGVALD